MTAKATGALGAQQYQVQGIIWEVGSVAAQLLHVTDFPHTYRTISPAQVMAGGRITVDKRLRLPGNAVVRSPFMVRVRAGQARWIRAGDVGEMRTADLSTGSSSGEAQARTSVTVDFGGLRTVSAVGLVSSSTLNVIQVKQWTGVGFAPQPVVGPFRTIDSATVAQPTILNPVVTFPSEVRTERLLVVLAGGASESAIRENLLVLLPDLPSDVQLSIDGGPPVWRAPGPVREGVEGWTLDSDSGLLSQEVDLAESLTALLGDPDADLTDEVELRVTLAAGQPGVLVVAVPEPSGPAVIRHRVRADVDPSHRETAFDAEGIRTIPLGLPDWVDRVESLEVRMSGELESERIFPPVGPDFPEVPAGGAPRVEMLLDANRAAAVRVPDLHGLDSLTAVRLPLLTADGDAEVQIVLLEDAGMEPGAPIDGGVSEPMTVAGRNHASWHTFPFPEAVEVDPGRPPLVAVAVSRGSVAWALSDDSEAGPVWQGPLAGPWLPLPPLRAGEPRGGRVRIVGRASKDRDPVAPLLVGVGEGSTRVPITPAGDGALQTIQPATPVATPVELELVSRALGSVRVEEVVVVATTS